MLPGLALLDVNTHDSACISLLSVGSSLQVMIFTLVFTGSVYSFQFV